MRRGWVVAALLLGAVEADARPGNPERYPVGARQMGMGGAGLARAYTPWFNPAGAGAAPKSGLSASLSAYGATFESARLLDVPVTGGGRIQGDISAFSLDLFPASVEYVLPLGDLGALTHGVAFSLVVPDFSQVDGTLEAPPTDIDFEFRASQAQSTQTFWLGAAWGACWRTLCFGAGPSAAVLLRDEFTTSTLALVAGGERFDLTQTLVNELIVGSLGGQVGLQWQAHPRLRLGLSARSAMRTLGSTGSILVTSGQVGSGEAFVDRVEVQNPQQDFRVPWRFAAGFEWQPAARWRIAADARLSLGQAETLTIAGPNGERSLPPAGLGVTVDDPTRALDVSSAFALRPTVNVNGGVTFSASDRVRLQVGAFTDLSATPDADILDNGRDQQSRVSITLGGGWKGETVETWVSVVYAEGWGSAAGLGEGFEFTRTPLSSRSVYVMVGSWANL